MMHQYHIFCILVFHKDENVENLTVTPTLEGNEEVCVLLKSAVAVFFFEEVVFAKASNSSLQNV